MASSQSDLPCTRCRQRRVKCDKRKPNCLRCEKLRQSCPGYVQERKFLDEGSNLRRKYRHQHVRKRNDSSSTGILEDTGTPTPSASNSRPRTQVDDRTSRVSADTARDDLSNSGGIPQDGCDCVPRSSPVIEQHDSVLDPIVTQPLMRERAFDVQVQGSGFELQSRHNQILDSSTEPVFSDETSHRELLYLEAEFFDLDPDTFYASHLNHCGFIPNVPSVSDESDRLGARHFPLADDGSTNQPESMFDSTSPFMQAGETISDDSEHEMACLIRHFTEVIGPWLDLYDRGRYFGSLVPIKALRNALLRYALVAAAAKQLGRVGGNKSLERGLCRQPALMEVYKDDNQVDWFYKAANYYDKAISHLRTYLYLLSDDGLLFPEQPSSLSASASFLADTDDLLAAISIFSVYEFLDHFETEWLQHLSGLQSLLVLEKRPRLSSWPRGLVPTRLLPEMTRGRRAAFWNFAREDYIAAYIHRTRTRLDTEDFPMWRASGLQITNSGSLYSPFPNGASSVDEDQAISEDLVPHTLVWIVLRIMNYIAATGGSSVDASPPGVSHTAGLHHSSGQNRYTRWMELQQQLDIWYRTLPDYFQPCARTKHYGNVPNTASAQQEPFTELFFSLPMCAAALQLYHFAWILLLLNKPAAAHDDHRSVSSVLRSYREVLEKAACHSREICGIALARPEGAVRVQMQQPLYLAGLCLDTPGDRKVVLDLLRDIEADTGCPTEFRVHQLLNEWNLEDDCSTVTLQ